LTALGRQWAAVLEGGPRAHLDGASALIASGLRNYSEERIRVSVPKGARIRRRRRASVDLRETRRFDPGDVIATGVPRACPAVAAVRGALWAASDRQASLIVTMTVQQGLCTVEHLGAALMKVRRDRRRLLLHDLVIDLAGGVRSLGELDFLRGCRKRGLPEPDMQVIRQAAGDRYYLDCRWDEWGVVVEVDGIQHSWAQELVRDALRHNTIALAGDVVLRLPVLGLRVCPDEFFAQVAEALRSAGCPLPEDLIA
jgi:very-short-patch-repair endonuclease